MSKQQPQPETHSMKGWGLKYADPTVPRTLEEAQVTGILMAADRLLDAATHLEDIMLRLARIERFLHECIPGYAEANQHPQQQSSPGHSDGTVQIKALRGIHGVRVH